MSAGSSLDLLGAKMHNVTMRGFQKVRKTPDNGFNIIMSLLSSFGEIGQFLALFDTRGLAKNCQKILRHKNQNSQ